MASILFGLFAGPSAADEFPDPAKLPAHVDLPNPLVMLDGTKVTSKEDWFNKRRPELKKLFLHYMYGQFPPKPDKITAKLLHEDKAAFGGKATLKELAITVGIEKAPPIYLMVVTPNQRKGPAPVFVGISFCGNYAMVDDPKIHIPTSWVYNGPGVKDNHATEAGRGKQKSVWNLEQSIDRGYAVATFYNGDIDPDVKETRRRNASLLEAGRQAG